MFTAVGDLLKILPRRSKSGAAVSALLVRQAFGEAVAEKCADLPGKVLASVRAVSFRDGTLTVSAPGLIATELSLRAGGLVDATNNLLGKKKVIRLRFKGG